jgi:hypothetical protein
MIEKWEEVLKLTLERPRPPLKTSASFRVVEVVMALESSI